MNTIELSTSTRSSSQVFRDWTFNRKIETSIKEVGLQATAELILADLEKIKGHGLSSDKLNHYRAILGKQKDARGLMSSVANAMLAGDGMAVYK